MYLKARSWYGTDGEQKADGLYLLLVQRPFKDREGDGCTHSLELHACVRRARMSQCGHFMMASVRVGKRRVVLSGSCGSDGLPLSARDWEEFDAVLPHLVRVPDDVAEVYWHGDKAENTHNTVGPNAGKALRKWAFENLKALRGR